MHRPHVSTRSRWSKRIASLVLGILFLLPQLWSAAPAWWSQRGATNANPADNYAAANLGQLKHFASKAAEELDAHLPGGAGPTITNLIASWHAAPASGTTRDDTIALTVGQLKYVAKLYYDRFLEAGYSGLPLTSGQTYPWDNSPTPAENTALANLGQVKQIFAFDITKDTDVDGLPDWWEQKYFGDLTQTASGDFDGDGMNNIVEFLQGRNPLKGSASDTFSVVNLSIFTPLE